MKNLVFDNFGLMVHPGGACYLMAKDRNEHASDQLFLGMLPNKEEREMYEVIVEIKPIQTEFRRKITSETSEM